MKTKRTSTLALAALALVLALQATALAEIIFKNPDGTPFTGGPVTLHLTFYDCGTLYNGVIGDHGSATPSVGAPILDGLASAACADSRSLAPYGNLQEDSWGVATVDKIMSGTKMIWRPGDTKYGNSELDIIFHGEQDFFVHGSPTIQTIDGVGLHADFYENPYESMGGIDGSRDRKAATDPTDPNGYPGVTDTGTKVLSASSVPGFIRGVGDYGGLATEFESNFIPGSVPIVTGRTVLAADASGGGANLALYSKFNSDAIVSSVPGGSTLPADFDMVWSQTADYYTGWLVSGDGNAAAALVPEPGSLVLLAGGVVVLLVCRKLRRRS